MPTAEPRSLSDQSKSLCVDHVCPQCGTTHQVTVERVIEGTTSITRCHCRACGSSWHPQVTEEAV